MMVMAVHQDKSYDEFMSKWFFFAFSWHKLFSSVLSLDASS